MWQPNILKITTKNHWKQFPVWTPIMAVVFGLIFFHDSVMWFLIFFFGVTLLISIPAILCHYDYYQRNKDAEYEITSDKIIVRKNQCEKIYLKSDIAEINVYITSVSWGSTMDYNFAQIDMKNGETIYLTSLLYPKKAEEIIKKYFKDMPYNREINWSYGGTGYYGLSKWNIP